MRAAELNTVYTDYIDSVVSYAHKDESSISTKVGERVEQESYRWSGNSGSLFAAPSARETSES